MSGGLIQTLLPSPHCIGTTVPNFSAHIANNMQSQNTEKVPDDGKQDEISWPNWAALESAEQEPSFRSRELQSSKERNCSTLFFIGSILSNSLSSFVYRPPPQRFREPGVGSEKGNMVDQGTRNLF